MISGPVLKVRQPYAKRLVCGGKRHEVRSKSIFKSGVPGCLAPVQVGSWVWVASTAAKHSPCCKVLGGARFEREYFLDPNAADAEAVWNTFNHTVEGSCADFVRGMPPGYRTGLYIWQFGGARELDGTYELEQGERGVTWALKGFTHGCSARGNGG